VNGVSGTNLKSNGSYDFRTTTPNLLGTFDGWVDHNADGTKTINMSGSFSTPSSWISGGNVSGNATLPTIPRATTPALNYPGIFMGTPITVDLSSRASSSFTHTLRYAFGSATGTIATKTAATSVQWTPPVSLATQIPAATWGGCIIYCDTYLGDTLIGTKTASFNLVVPDYVVPTVNNVAFQMQSSHPVVTGWGVFVKGFSAAKITATAAGAYGSTIVSYTFQLIKDAKVLYTVTQPGNQWTSPVLTEAGNYIAYVVAWDTRGRHAGAYTSYFSVHNYSAPTVSGIDVFRCLSDGTKDLANGTYISAKATYNHSSVGGRNSLTKKIEYRKIGAAGWTLGQNNPDNNTPYVFGSGGISVASTYEVAFTAQDALSGAVVYIVRVLPGLAAIHIRPGGKGLGIGGACDTDNQLQVYWPAIFKDALKVNANDVWHPGNDTPLMRYRYELPVDANFNNYIDPGIYTITNNIYHVNGPGWPWGVLAVFKTGGNYIIQFAVKITDGSISMRTFNQVSWSSWHPVYIPNKPYLYVRNSSAVVKNAGEEKLSAFYYKLHDDWNTWNYDTQRFTAPLTGKYQITVGGRWDTYSDSTNVRYGYIPYVNGNRTHYIGGGVLAQVDTPSSTGSMTLKLNQGDYLEMYMYSAVNMSVSYNNHLGIFLQIQYLGA